MGLAASCAWYRYRTPSIRHLLPRNGGGNLRTFRPRWVESCSHGQTEGDRVGLGALTR